MLALLVLVLIVAAVVAAAIVERRRVRLGAAAQQEAVRLRRRFEAYRTTLGALRRAADRAEDPPATSS